jgi:hypothetical protein
MAPPRCSGSRSFVRGRRGGCRGRLSLSADLLAHALEREVRDTLNSLLLGWRRARGFPTRRKRTTRNPCSGSSAVGDSPRRTRVSSTTRAPSSSSSGYAPIPSRHTTSTSKRSTRRRKRPTSLPSSRCRGASIRSSRCSRANGAEPRRASSDCGAPPAVGGGTRAAERLARHRS